MAGGNFSANGFACWDVSAPGFFGPVGVNPAMQRKVIGAALLHRCLESMLQQGYGYVIIGGVSDPEFYAKSAGAVYVLARRLGSIAAFLKRE